ncbi:hypothetical protein IF188_09095 [Microbacterium sp. NEAU-LLC]|uniref:Uncharacterized protein n=1 Tax=Microbacterium helvum TaxID=2773713 RepID=A0ABR8NPD5_9MICO|nr:hypothetical protein [Microbacterium helvum]MBD3941848.1 hypothetical protein [Microbacterium helvum]
MHGVKHRGHEPCARGHNGLRDPVVTDRHCCCWGGLGPRGGHGAATCEAISDVMTIQDNVDAAVRQGRMGLQERDGWYRLATRELQRIPTQSTSLLSQQLAAFQATIPHTDPGAFTTPVVGTDVWGAAASQLSQLCAAAGHQIILQGFTGG